VAATCHINPFFVLLALEASGCRRGWVAPAGGWLAWIGGEQSEAGADGRPLQAAVGMARIGCGWE
jgi:hypothetical protein